eukprot:SAG31_NODE_2056_length_6546_cov_1.979060_5_plen_133_part_00
MTCTLSQALGGVGVKELPLSKADAEKGAKILYSELSGTYKKLDMSGGNADGDPGYMYTSLMRDLNEATRPKQVQFGAYGDDSIIEDLAHSHIHTLQDPEKPDLRAVEQDLKLERKQDWGLDISSLCTKSTFM